MGLGITSPLQVIQKVKSKSRLRELTRFTQPSSCRLLTDEQKLADDLPDGDESEVVALHQLEDEADGVGDLERGQDEHGEEPAEDGRVVPHVDADEEGKLRARAHHEPLTCNLHALYHCMILGLREFVTPQPWNRRFA